MRFATIALLLQKLRRHQAIMFTIHLFFYGPNLNNNIFFGGYRKIIYSYLYLFKKVTFV